MSLVILFGGTEADALHSVLLKDLLHQASPLLVCMTTQVQHDSGCGWRKRLDLKESSSKGGWGRVTRPVSKRISNETGASKIRGHFHGFWLLGIPFSN